MILPFNSPTMLIKNNSICKISLEKSLLWWKKWKWNSDKRKTFIVSDLFSAEIVISLNGNWNLIMLKFTRISYEQRN